MKSSKLQYLPQENPDKATLPAGIWEADRKLFPLVKFQLKSLHASDSMHIHKIALAAADMFPQFLMFDPNHNPYHRLNHLPGLTSPSVLFTAKQQLPSGKRPQTHNNIAPFAAAAAWIGIVQVFAVFWFYLQMKLCIHTSPAAGAQKFFPHLCI